jgi:hypothetical protein
MGQGNNWSHSNAAKAPPPEGATDAVTGIGMGVAVTWIDRGGQRQHGIVTAYRPPLLAHVRTAWNDNLAVSLRDCKLELNTGKAEEKRGCAASTPPRPQDGADPALGCRRAGFTSEEPQERQERKEQDMSRKPGLVNEKVCNTEKGGCGKPYKPKSNSQVFCEECGERIHKAKAAMYREKHVAKKTGKGKGIDYGKLIKDAAETVQSGPIVRSPLAPRPPAMEGDPVLKVETGKEPTLPMLKTDPPASSLRTDPPGLVELKERQMAPGMVQRCRRRMTQVDSAAVVEGIPPTDLADMLEVLGDRVSRVFVIECE